MQAELKQHHQEAAAAAAEAERTANERLRQLSEQLEGGQSSSATRIAELQQQLARKQAESEQRQQEIEAQLSAARAEALKTTTVLQEERAKLTESLTLQGELQQQLAHAREELEQRSAALAAASSDSASSHSVLTEQLAQQSSRAREAEKLLESTKAQLVQEQGESARALQEAREHSANELKLLGEKHQSDLAQMRASYEQQLAELRSQLHEARARASAPPPPPTTMAPPPPPTTMAPPPPAMQQAREVPPAAASSSRDVSPSSPNHLVAASKPIGMPSRERSEERDGDIGLSRSPSRAENERLRSTVRSMTSELEQRDAEIEELQQRVSRLESEQRRAKASYTESSEKLERDLEQQHQLVARLEKQLENERRIAADKTTECEQLLSNWVSSKKAAEASAATVAQTNEQLREEREQRAALEQKLTASDGKYREARASLTRSEEESGARIKELETQLRRESSASTALQSSNTELTAQLDNVCTPCTVLLACCLCLPAKLTTIRDNACYRSGNVARSSRPTPIPKHRRSSVSRASWASSIGYGASRSDTSFHREWLITDCSRLTKADQQTNGAASAIARRRTTTRACQTNRYQVLRTSDSRRTANWYVRVSREQAISYRLFTSSHDANSYDSGFGAGSRTRASVTFERTAQCRISAAQASS